MDKLDIHNNVFSLSNFKKIKNNTFLFPLLTVQSPVTYPQQPYTYPNKETVYTFRIHPNNYPDSL